MEIDTNKPIPTHSPSPPPLEPEMENSVKTDTKPKNQEPISIPLITDFQFHVWLYEMTRPGGPYPNGIPIGAIRKLIDDQWEEETESEKSRFIDRAATKASAAKVTKNPQNISYWRHKNQLFVVLHRETKAGRIVRIHTGVYKGLSEDEIKEAQSKSLNESVSAKRKKSDQATVCRVCLKKELKPGSFLVCSTCEVPYHITCARNRMMLPSDIMTMNNLDQLRSAVGNWTCFDCKRCAICQGVQEEPKGNRLLLCDRCNSAEHYKCQRPIPKTVPFMPWYCTQCRSVKTDGKINIGLGDESGQVKFGETSAPLVIKKKRDVYAVRNVTVGTMDKNGHGISVLANGHKSEERGLDKYGLPTLHLNPILLKIDAEVKKWDVTKTVQLFLDFGMEQVAEFCRQQEIDGAALLLLTRQDILEKMNLKLGPALKACRLVVFLQNMSSPYWKKNDGN